MSGYFSQSPFMQGGFGGGGPQMQQLMGYLQQRQQMPPQQFGYPSMMNAMRGNVLGPPQQQMPPNVLAMAHPMVLGMPGMPHPMPGQMPFSGMGGGPPMGPGVANFQQHWNQLPAPGQNPYAQRMSGFFNQPQPPPMQSPAPQQPANVNPMAGRLGAGHSVQQPSFFG